MVTFLDLQKDFVTWSWFCVGRSARSAITLRAAGRLCHCWFINLCGKVCRAETFWAGHLGAAGRLGHWFTNLCRKVCRASIFWAGHLETAGRLGHCFTNPCRKVCRAITFWAGHLGLCSTVCVVASGFPTPRYRHNWTEIWFLETKFNLQTFLCQSLHC